MSDKDIANYWKTIAIHNNLSEEFIEKYKNKIIISKKYIIFIMFFNTKHYKNTFMKNKFFLCSNYTEYFTEIIAKTTLERTNSFCAPIT